MKGRAVAEDRNQMRISKVEAGKGRLSMVKVKAGCYGTGLSWNWSLRFKGTLQLGQVNGVRLRNG